MTRRLVDLSHVIFHGLETYPGLPPPRLTPFMTHDASQDHYAPGTCFHIGGIEMVGNTGTYIDAPYHRYEDGTDIAGLSLASVADLPGQVVRVTDASRAIGADALSGIADVAGRAVLIETRWSRHWGTSRYAQGYPFLTADAADLLAARGAALVGIDSLNIDDNSDGARPVHSRLLAAGIPVVEHLKGLSQLPQNGFRFFAVPAPVRGMGSFPVRAFASIDQPRDTQGAQA